jgi:hypothetical protein
MSSSRLRELREEDAGQVAALFGAAFGEARKLDAREITSWLRDPYLQPENLRVLEADGRIVGYCDIAPRNGELRVYERIGMQMTRRYGIWQKDL